MGVLHVYDGKWPWPLRVIACKLLQAAALWRVCAVGWAGLGWVGLGWVGLGAHGRVCACMGAVGVGAVQCALHYTGCEQGRSTIEISKNVSLEVVPGECAGGAASGHAPSAWRQ